MAFDRRRARRWGRDYLAYLDELLPENKTAPILDAGCGDGYLRFTLRETGFMNLHGVEPSREQVATARQICPGVEDGNLTDYLLAHPEAFEVVISTDVIDQRFRQEEVLAFLDACYAALKPGGRLILQTMNIANPLVRGFCGFPNDVAFSPDSLLELLGVCGFIQGEAREMRPLVHGVGSFSKWVLWKCLRRLWTPSTADKGRSAVHTALFLATCRRPD